MTKTKTQSRVASTRAPRKPAATGKRQPKPKTAYELLERVCVAIASEPERFNQSNWCGSAFCRAGWMVLLNDGSLDLNSGARADELLGMSEGDTWPLFSTCDLFKPRGASPGTPQYVQAGIDGTREFMKQNEAHLKARLLKGV